MQILLSPHEYERRVRDIHNHLYANANVRTNEGIATEVAKVLLAMIWAASGGTSAPPPLSEQQQAAAITGEPGVCDAIAAETAKMFRRMNAELQRYGDDELIDLDERSVAYIRSRLDPFDLSSGERDWLGDAMEVFRSLDAKRLGGQFFTDQRITDLAVSLLEFDVNSGDDFVDICAGTGGFLLAAARRISRARHLMHLPAQPIKGLEVDAALHSVANGSLATFMPKDEYVLQADSLASPSNWPTEVKRRIVPGTHTCLASNPPFGTKITIKDPSILSQFDLARCWSRGNDRWEARQRGLSPRPPDILFMERNLQLAEPGRGRVALVTPYQILSGPQLGYVREWLLRHARVRAVIDLPVETFQPWTGTKTSLVVYERRKEVLDHWDPDRDPYEIFMAVARDIGHDRRGQPTFDESGQIRTDLPSIRAAFEAYRRGEPFEHLHEDSFITKSRDINVESDLRLNASFYRPVHRDLKESLDRKAKRRGWQVSTIGEITTRIFYPTRFKRSYVDAGTDSIPFYGGSQISQLIPTSDKFLSRTAKNIDDLIVREGWILVTRSGTTGIVSSVPRAWDGIAMSEHVIRIVPNGIVSPEYIETYLRSSVGQSLLAAGIFGSVIDEITPEHIASIPIPLLGDSQQARVITKLMCDAQQARNAAIENIDRAVSVFESEVKDVLQSVSHE